MTDTTQMGLSIATPEQIDTYRNDRCWAIAGAIHLRTGWQMVLSTFDDGVTGHVMVQTPDGRLVDIDAVEDAKCDPGEELLNINDLDNLKWGVSFGDIQDVERVLAKRIVARLLGHDTVAATATMYGLSR